MWPGNPLPKAGVFAPVHTYRGRENATLWASAQAVVLGACWGRKGRPLSSGTYRASQVGSPEKHGAMAQLGVHLAMLAALTAG